MALSLVSLNGVRLPATQTRGFRRGDLIVVMLPETADEPASERPALVVSEGVAGGEDLLWVVMVSASADGYPLIDVHLDEALAELGRRPPSSPRSASMGTVAAQSAEVIGRLEWKTYAKVEAVIEGVLAR